MRILAIILASVWCLTVISGSSTFLPANAQQPVSRLPILLIHGYGENSNIWNSWIDWLRSDHLNNTTSKVYLIIFPKSHLLNSAISNSMFHQVFIKIQYGFVENPGTWLSVSVMEHLAYLLAAFTINTSE